MMRVYESRLCAALLLSLVTAGCKRESAGSGESGPAPKERPQIRDNQLASLLVMGAPDCVVYAGGLFDGCPAADRVKEYVNALPAAGKADAAETCTAFLPDSEHNSALLAATCMECFGTEDLTRHMSSALDAMRQNPDDGVRQAIARTFKRADASAANLEREILAYVRSTDEEPTRPSTAFAVSSLVETLFVNPSGAPRATSPAVQAWALEALATAKNQQFAALEQWPRIVDKNAACSALVKSVQGSSTWIDTMTVVVMRTHDCDARLVDFFAALVEKVPQDPNDFIVTVLQDIDARVEVPSGLRALAAQRLRERHEQDARTMRDGPLTQEWLQTFAEGAAHFVAPRSSRP